MLLLKSVLISIASSKMAEAPAKKFCSSLGREIKIAVEGNIAAGKSTFLKILESHSTGYHVIGEPLSRWTNIPSDDEDVTSSQQYGSNLLDMFYKDPKRYAYTFQTYACLSRLRAQLRDIPQHLQSIPNPVIFYERSVYSDKFCFAQNCHESGLINDVEWSVYCDWHSFLIKYLHLEFDGFIYLKSTPEVAMKRLKKRDRPEEREVTLDYLQSLHDKHNNWLIDNKTKLLPSVLQSDVPVLVIDCDEDFEDSQENQKEILGKVDNFIDLILKATNNT